MGMINGSAIANVATTGTITIPLMKKTGYKKDFAAAVEAVASTGGQFTPPIMGAVGFVMAEFMCVSYTKAVSYTHLQKIIRRISDQNVADVEHHRVHAVPRHGFVFKIESDSVFHFLRSFLLADEWAAQRLLPSSLTKSVHFTV